MSWSGTPRTAAWLLLLLWLAARPVALHAQVAAEADQGRAGSNAHSVVLARSLFEQGLRHVDAEEWSLAADRFSRVLELRYSAVAAYNLALSRARLGRSVSALAALRDLLAQPALEPTVRDAALALQREAEATVGRLTVSVHGACSGCRVLLDGTPLPPASFGLAVPVDPGHHALALLEGDRELDSTDLTIARGAKLDVRLGATSSQPVAADVSRRQPEAASPNGQPGAADAAGFAPSSPGASAPTAALAPADGATSSASGSLLTNPWFWAGLGVLAAGVVTLGVVLAAGGTDAAAPVPGDFTPGVLSGEVRR